MNHQRLCSLLKRLVMGVFFAACLPALARAAEPLSFYVNYASRVPTAPLVAHPLSIVHPDATVDLAAAHRAGGTVLAYISVGEVASDAAYRGEVARRGLPYAGRNEVWKSDLIDLTDARWPAFIVEQLAGPAAQKGFDGFFLDTLDAVEFITGNPARTAAAKAGLVATIRGLRAAFPQKKIIANRGFFAFAEIRDLVDGVLVESLYETHDFNSKAYRAVARAETDAVLAELAKVTAAGRAVYVLDYVDPNDPARATATAKRIQAHGFHAFVSTPSLDGIALAPLRPVARRIAAFYGNLTTVQEDQVKWPSDSFVSQKLQLPLEWLGYEVDYFRVAGPGDLPELDADYRAILLPRYWEIPTTAEPAVVDWLIKQRAAGRKIVVFGSLPFQVPEERIRFLNALGIEGDGSIIKPPLRADVLTRDAALMDYEVPVTPLPTGHLNLRAPAGARKHYSVQSRDSGAPSVAFDAIFTCDWGGMALDPYLIFRRPDFREFWHIDPFAFLALALGDYGAPAPDTTTRDGLRLFLSHIDGDGFSNFSRVEVGKRSAEVIRDRILKKYPLPITVSIIEAEVRGMIRTQASEEAPALEAIARDIFALPHIELASHSFSHPFFWIVGDRTESFYDEQALDLKVPYPKVDLTREIEGSVRYINESLAPAGRQVRVFLWSGNCRPPPEALALVRRLGLENLNGGDTIITARDRSLTAIAPRTMPWGDELQIFAPNQNENVYTNNWRGPLFGTFSHVLETFNLTESPRRLKPINLYYHFYSGDYPASVQALETIYDWLMTQPIHGIEVSHYARIARDARNTAVFAAGSDRWVIVNAGESRTLRLPAAVAARIDLAKSSGVTGWKVERDQAYVHTDGSPNVALVLGDAPSVAPRLESSSGEIAFAQRSATASRFSVRDLRPVETIFAGLAPGQRVRATVNAAAQNLAADADGRLKLSLPSQAEVALDFAAPAP